MEKQLLKIEKIPAIIYGVKSDKIYIYVHGKHSKKEEAENFASIAIPNGYQVISFDLPEHGDRVEEQYECTVQNAVADLKTIYTSLKTEYTHFSLFANSLGAYFSLIAYQDIHFDNTLFLSPILNMERIIQNIMKWSNVTVELLEEKKNVDTAFGEKLSWSYYQYVKNHPVTKWHNQIYILYGENDNLTERFILNSFSEKFNCNVDIMNNGEHYFHTQEQLCYLENWIRRSIH